MECIIGMQFKDFVLLASDKTAARSIFAMKHDHDKMFHVNKQTLMAVCGDAGDAVQFSEYIVKNVQLYKMRNGYDLSPHAAASFTRKFLADYLRTRDAYQVNLLLGGYDKEEGPALYFMDYLSSMVKLPFACHGYSSFFSLSVLDRFHRDDMSREEAVELLQKCINEVHTRFIVNQGMFQVRVIDKDGVHELPDVTPSMIENVRPQ